MDIKAPRKELGLIGVENDIKEEPNGTYLPMESFRWKEVNLTNIPSYTDKIIAIYSYNMHMSTS
jgi:hypothetical protein